jgi:hypothetical protein
MADTLITVPPAQIVTTATGSVMETIQEKIISAFVAAMSVITIANGYNCNAGEQVFRCKKNLDPQELPAIVVWPGIETGEKKASGYQYCDMKMGIESIGLFGSANPSFVATRLLGDLIQAVFGQSVTTLADEIIYESGGTDTYPDAGEVAIGVKINLSVKYFYLIGNPYSQ